MESQKGKLMRTLYEKARVLHDFRTDIDGYEEFPDGAAISKLTVANRAKGVSLIAHLHSIDSATPCRLHVVVRLRTRGAAYRTLLSKQATSEEALDEALDKAKAALNYKPIDPAFLPEPWRFKDDKFDVKPGRKPGQVRVSTKSQIKAVEVMRVVAVNHDGVLSSENITNPHRECWYLLDCVGHMGAIFNIITDGEIFYPTNRVTQDSSRTVRLAQSGPSKMTVNLADLSIVDKELINRAIEEWVQQTL